MAMAEALVRELEAAKKHFSTTISVFTADDAGYAPSPELYTVSGHIAHVADSIDWFVEGAFGKGWSMDFPGMIAKAKAVTTLSDATAWLERSFANAAKTLGAASDQELHEAIPDTRIMAGAPRLAIVSGITDHTAHHRGALAVYARLVGKEPPMPYA